MKSISRPHAYEVVTAKIIEHLEKGVVPWRRPWRTETGRPRNFHTGKMYQGVNVLLLGMESRPSPWWLTFRQTTLHGGSVIKGERGALVLKWGRYEKAKEPTVAIEESSKRASFFLKSYHVFNACQIDGIEFPTPDASVALCQSERIERAQQIVASMPMPPSIEEGKHLCASYSSALDRVAMPAFEQFKTPEGYYLTLFHELAHATGHERRLNRKTLGNHDGFGGKVYSQEELIAEMAAAFVAAEAEISRDEHEQSAAYLNAWLGVLRDRENRKWLVHAAAQAGRAADFILGRDAAEQSPEAGGAIVV